MRILLVGYDGGLGTAIETEADKYSMEIEQGTFNVMDDEAIASFLEFQWPFDAIVYAAGVNRISKFDDLQDTDFWESMDVNCFGLVRLLKMIRIKAKWQPRMRVCMVTSNAANMPMSHSLSYNCSKAAANMMVRQLAREIPVDEMCIFAVAPNKLKGTPMSREIEKKVCEMRGWTEEEAEAYQLAALPAHVETPPDVLAEFIVELLRNHCPYIHGTIIPFGGPQ